MELKGQRKIKEDGAKIKRTFPNEMSKFLQSLFLLFLPPNFLPFFKIMQSFLFCHFLLIMTAFLFFHFLLFKLPFSGLPASRKTGLPLFCNSFVRFTSQSTTLRPTAGLLRLPCGLWYNDFCGVGLICVVV